MRAGIRKRHGAECMMEMEPVVDVFLKIRCSKREHHICSDMQDMLLDGCINVTEAATVKPHSGPCYCVFAMAKVDRDRIKQFERKVLGLRRNGLGVADLNMDVVYGHEG